MSDYVTKDSGERTQFASGMMRDTATGKSRPDLAFDGPLVWTLWDGTSDESLMRCAQMFFEESSEVNAAAVVHQLVHREGGLRVLVGRYTALMMRGAVKYAEQNWMLAEGTSELQRFRISFCRHLEQYIFGDVDEDHAAAVMFNMNGYLYVSKKLREKANEIPF